MHGHREERYCTKGVKRFVSQRFLSTEPQCHARAAITREQSRLCAKNAQYFALSLNFKKVNSAIAN
jgi:hypothetical protein